MKKIKKCFAALCAVGVMAVSAVQVTCFAKSLKDSFSSGTEINYDHYELLSGDWYSKSCWAKTSGYYKYHYVRAMVGSGSNVWADTNRCYSYGDIKRTCTTDAIPCSGWSWSFPTGYAYYGN